MNLKHPTQGFMVVSVLNYLGDILLLIISVNKFEFFICLSQDIMQK
jgi:hypothetical protein